jgi:DMSO/TMAO reductase YedYZ molybdopterin-dependent catalytic subunit
MLAFLIIASSCSNPDEIEEAPVDGVTQATESRYMESEIRDYEGIRLDPSIGPRDNSIKGIQNIDIDSYTLLVTGLVDEPLTYRYEEVLSLPAYEKLVTLHCVEGWESTVLWKGFLIEDIIEPSSLQASANTIIFHCADDYNTSMSIADVIEGKMILAYWSNGVELPPDLGYPFIVVAEDKIGYKWARWFTEIEITNDPDFKGYWESLGYDNEGDLK